MIKKIRKIKKRYWVLGIIMVLIIVFILRKQGQSDSFSRFTVKSTDVSDELLLAGTIDATRRVDLGFAAGGRVSKNNFKVGDTVKKGDVIAELSQNNLSSNLIQAQANYTLTKVDTASSVDNVEISYDTKLAEQNSIVEGLYRQYLSADLKAYYDGEQDVDKSAPTVSGSYKGTSEGSYTIDVYSSSGGYAYRLRGLESKTYSVKTNQSGELGSLGLYLKFEPEISYSNTQWVVEVPNTRSSTYFARKTAYENALAARDRIIAEAKNDLERITLVKGGSETTRPDAERNQARAQVSAVVAQLGDGKITAPFDGVIAKNDLEIGEIVNAFTPIVTIFGGSQKELNLNVPEIYINKIKVGDAVTVSIDAYVDIEFEGTIAFIDFIDTEVDGVPVYLTDVILNKDDDRVRVGMNAKASIISQRKEDILAIPKHYISDDLQGNKTVRREKDEVITLEVIEIGLEGNEGLVEVLSGLNEGDIIILDKE